MPFSKRLARYTRRALLALAVTVTLAAGFVTVENWRGDRAWRVVAAEYAARGEPLDVLPPPTTLPPEKNFMATPALARLVYPNLEAVEDVEGFLRVAPGPANRAFGWRDGKVFDAPLYLEAQMGTSSIQFAVGDRTFTVQRLLPPPAADRPRDAVAVQAQLNAVAPWLDEAKTAVALRPDSQWMRPEPIRIEAPFAAPVPHFQSTRALLVALTARACAALQQDDVSAACEDALAALRLSRGFGSSPDSALLEAMIGVVGVNLSLQPVWEGCRRHLWREPELARLQMELGKVQLLAGMERSVRLERVATACTLDGIGNPETREAVGGGGIWHRALLRWAPRGWVQQNKVTEVRLMQAGLDAIVAQSTPHFREQLAERDRVLGVAARRPMAPYSFLASATLPAFDKLTRHAALAETNVRLAQVACALERYRLAEGEYPENLRGLAPVYLSEVPVDVVDGQLLRYQRLSDGSFRLYSIGLQSLAGGGAPDEGTTPGAGREGEWSWPQMR